MRSRRRAVFRRSYLGALAAPPRPWGRVFRFSAEIGIRDYIINIHVTPPRDSPLCRDGRAHGHTGTRAHGQHTSSGLTCARYLPARRNCTGAFGAQSRVLYMAGTISAFVRTRCAQPSPYLPLRPSLPQRSPSFRPSLSRALSPLHGPRRGGIKYNKDIHWELIGYLRIYRPLWVHCCAGAVTARAAASFLLVPSPFSPFLRLLRLSRSFFVFHLFCRPSLRAAPGRMEIFRGGIISGHVFRERNAPMHRLPACPFADRRRRPPTRSHHPRSLAFSRERAHGAPGGYLTNPSMHRGPGFSVFLTAGKEATASSFTGSIRNVDGEILISIGRN